MATIKVEPGVGFVKINGALHPKNSFTVTPFSNGEIRLGDANNFIAVGLFSDYIDNLDAPFATQALAMTHLEICFI